MFILDYIAWHNSVCCIQLNVRFGCPIRSHSTTNIAICVHHGCRPRQPISTKVSVLTAGRSLARKLLKMRSKCDNMFCIIRPGNLAYVEQRELVPCEQAPGGLYKATMGWLPRIIRDIKYTAFLEVRGV